MRIVGAPQIQFFYPLKILLLSYYEERVTSPDLLCIDINCKYFVVRKVWWRYNDIPSSNRDHMPWSLYYCLGRTFL